VGKVSLHIMQKVDCVHCHMTAVENNNSCRFWKNNEVLNYLGGTTLSLNPKVGTKWRFPIPIFPKMGLFSHKNPKLG
jgi:hypothetical protein